MIKTMENKIWDAARMYDSTYNFKNILELME